MAPKKPPYSQDDDRTLITFVVLTRDFDFPKGNHKWKTAVEKGILQQGEEAKHRPERTWQSMRERWVKQILPQEGAAERGGLLEEYGVPATIREAMEQGAPRERWTARVEQERFDFIKRHAHLMPTALLEEFEEFKKESSGAGESSDNPPRRQPPSENPRRRQPPSDDKMFLNIQVPLGYLDRNQVLAAARSSASVTVGSGTSGTQHSGGIFQDRAGVPNLSANSNIDLVDLISLTSSSEEEGDE